MIHALPRVGEITWRCTLSQFHSDWNERPQAEGNDQQRQRSQHLRHTCRDVPANDHVVDLCTR